MQTKQPIRSSKNISFRPGVLKQSPQKNKMLMGVTFSKKASIRTLNTSNTKDNNAFHYRCSTHSIEQLHHSNSVQNVQIEREDFKKEKESDEMFGRSYAKIQKLKGTFQNSEINNQLNDIMILIKQEKLKIRQKMKQLEKTNTYLRKVCQGDNFDKCNAGVNTEELIGDGLESELIDKSIQCDETELSSQTKIISGNTVSARKIKEAYGKLHTMLTEMNINPLDILPQEGMKDLNVEAKSQFKNLSDTQIIKIQRFFIKKLAVKVQK